jgi:hypothetical protein
MAGWKFPGTQFGSALAQVGAGDDRDFMPAVPIDIAIPFENYVKPGFIEWHGCLGVPEQLCELAALKFKHLFRRPILAFHQHFINALAECRGSVHEPESKLQNLPLANEDN